MELVRMSAKTELSVIVTYAQNQRYDNVEELFYAYKKGLEATGLAFEMIYVVEGDMPDVVKSITNLIDQGEKIILIKLSTNFGPATALHAGFDQAAGELIMTLPEYQQVDEHDIPKMVSTLDGNDMVIARRWPRRDSILNRIQSGIFHFIIRSSTGFKFQDLGCSVRVFKRVVLEKISVYGDQHRFIPLLAHQMGFTVTELKVKQANKDVFQRIYPLGVYTRRMLDILSIFFLIKFTRKPLRFFGLIGIFVFILGVLLGLLLFVQRNYFGMPMADRPLLLIFLLLMIIGVQLFAVGLIGEIIIFTHSKDLNQYVIEKIYSSPKKD